MSAVTSNLRTLGIQHRFILSGGKQQLILANSADIEAVQQVIEDWQSGNLQGKPVLSRQPIMRFSQKPAILTLIVIFLGFTGAALAGFGRQFIYPFSFWDTSQLFYVPLVELDPWAEIKGGQFWRLITPIFLHFGPVHIVFNALWIWYLGTMVELHQGKLALLVLVLVIGVVSNTAQALVSTGIIFGGLSGVVHGLFSYCWLWGKMNKNSSVQVPNALFVIISALMLLSPLGILDIIVGAEIADTAHISGYITGLFCALAAHLLNSVFSIEQEH